jgi:hypothetical protein
VVDLAGCLLHPSLAGTQRSPHSTLYHRRSLVLPIAGPGPARTQPCHPDERLPFFVLAIDGVIAKGSFSFEQS